jgi:Ser/Thr protein kinase RdoA (MazF antagonist)
MSFKTSSQGGHSAQVEMRLLCNGHTWRVVQLGPDFLHLETPVSHPPAAAEIEMAVDGVARRWPVRLPEGIAATEHRVRLAEA